MSDDLKFQLRLTLNDEFAPVARNNPDDRSLSALTDILNRHDAVLKCQFDAFADYVKEAEALASVAPMRRDHLDAVLSQLRIQRIAVIGAIANQIFRLGFDHVEVET